MRQQIPHRVLLCGASCFRLRTAGKCDLHHIIIDCGNCPFPEKPHCAIEQTDFVKLHCIRKTDKTRPKKTSAGHATPGSRADGEAVRKLLTFPNSRLLFSQEGRRSQSSVISENFRHRTKAGERLYFSQGTAALQKIPVFSASGSFHFFQKRTFSGIHRKISHTITACCCFTDSVFPDAG